MHDHELSNISFMGCLWLKRLRHTHTHSLILFHPRTLHFLFVLLVSCDPALLEVKEQTTKKVGEKKLHQAGLWRICSNQVHCRYSSIPLFPALEICRCMGSNGYHPLGNFPYEIRILGFLTDFQVINFLCSAAFAGAHRELQQTDRGTGSTSASWSTLTGGGTVIESQHSASPCMTVDV